MTETAKQGTSKASATSAATETAVPEPAAQPGATGPQTTESDGTGPTGTEAAQPDLDETKRKFREALERKNHAHSEGQGQGGRDNNKISGAHGPASSRRNFRRKSG